MQPLEITDEMDHLPQSDHVLGIEENQDNSLNLKTFRASLVAQWKRIRLPVQETQVRSLVRKDPTGHKAVGHNY